MVSPLAFGSSGLSSWLSPATDSDPYLPDELRPHARMFMAFGAQASIWRDWTPAVQACLGLVASTIAQYEPLTILCRDEELELAQQLCGTCNTRFITTALDDIWMRDMSANFVIGSNGYLGAVDFNFNGWGNKQEHAMDARVARTISDDAGANYIQSALTGEGGGIEVDGEGTAILNESCWVNENRNPGWSRDQVEDELKAMLGLKKIIWLPGIKGKDITDAHVDFYARFVRPGVVIANLDNAPESYDYAVTRTHLDILRSATDANGRSLDIHTLPPPEQLRKNAFTSGNEAFAAGYVNYVVVRGAVIAPEFGDALADSYCKDLLQSLYPLHRIIQLNIDPIAAGGGGIHCVTHHQPQV
ncbi:agmatine deiminase family protein [Dyella choica]|uniref:Agmatine deiminase family protein n=1 Tax=Dyella choica TaxID=1927959 RepID=A0A3S0PQZ0_9GAMM|nr:agmatine deiminase family protein [Dyella choica]RUL78891.1 agmatine deiminase family protein [Dyella choica]